MRMSWSSFLRRFRQAANVAVVAITLAAEVLEGGTD
jgi:hypothetical protein